MAAASKIKDLTGPGHTDRFGIGGTDLGVTTMASGGRLVSVFGDTFERAGVGGPGWRSPVVLFGDPATVRTGIEWTGAAGPGDYAHQVLDYEHNSVIDGRRVTTMLPTDVVTIGNQMYLHVMVCEGLGNVHWTALHRSTDDGQTWRPTSATWPGGHHGGLFQVLTWERGGDGYVYVFSTGAQRDEGLILQRVPEDRLSDPGAWQTWGYGDGAWGWGNPPTVALTGAYGELCLRRVEDRWLLAFFDAGRYRIDVLSLDSPTANLYDAPRETLVQGTSWDAENHARRFGGSTLRGLPRARLDARRAAPRRQPVEHHHQLAVPCHAVPREHRRPRLLTDRAEACGLSPRLRTMGADPETAGDGMSEHARLEDLTKGARVRGVVPGGPVTVVAADWHGSDALTLTYTGESGAVDQQLLYRAHEPKLSLDGDDGAPSFTGDGAAFRLAAEAMRIRMAAQFDPMLAVTTSDLQPLPHQIQAVYGELLPRMPLRFLLADDPGAGKTVMAGLYIKELMLRGDLARCLVVAPGALVEQWQDELYDKFGLRFEVLTRALADSAIEGNVFQQHPLLIARMDQLSRSEDLLRDLEGTEWDLVVVDEAHRMSAQYYGSELKTTKRYDLGMLLGRLTRHLLLMTATPHSGKEADFQLFMALLDSDRFEGRYRQSVHEAGYDDLMRRMVKEDLLTFEGKPLFPERLASTVPYELSPQELELYEEVTQYVREEMNRADQLKTEGESGRGNTVGFALTILQRRLASSPEAILKSLQRRHQRLEKRRHEMLSYGDGDTAQPARRLQAILGGQEPEPIDTDDVDELPRAEREQAEEQVVDAASAARTAAELQHEINVLAGLEDLARRVRHSDTDRKWSELRRLLLEESKMYDSHGARRKIIVFTEHRDTLDYLADQIRGLLGRDEAAVTIHGGVRRDDRRATQERFTHDPDCTVLVATDAAGEGLNLQRAHLMVNYDLPWNPNRIEQRFGRIHRIGQAEACHLWNLVAKDTREGDVFQRLLDKVESQSKAFRGKVFDVLGQAFEDHPLRDLIVQAIRYGDQPDVRARLDRIIDAHVGEGLDQLIAERALHRDALTQADLAELRQQMEEARARRLQPHYIHAFFDEAFRRLGGRMSPRESGRYEITHVPAALRERQTGPGAPVLRRYERVCFDRAYIHLPGKTQASLLAPGHPLLDAVVAATIERHDGELQRGAVLVDHNDPGEDPRMLVAVTQRITDGHDPARTVSKRFDFVEFDPDGTARPAGPAPYLDYAPPDEGETSVLGEVTEQEWVARGFEQPALAWAIQQAMPAQLERVQERVSALAGRARRMVRQRLNQEINYWDNRYAELLDEQAVGKTTKIRPDTAERRARDLERRLDRRLAELDRDEALQALPPQVAGGALVVPRGLLDRLLGRAPAGAPGQDAADTREVERRAIAAVLRAERELGREPEEMPPNNAGYDIRSLTEGHHTVFLEVKGRTVGAENFYVTRNEVLFGKNADRYRLALVAVHSEGAHRDELRYLTEPFAGFEFGDFDAVGMTGHWDDTWAKGGSPQ